MKKSTRLAALLMVCIFAVMANGSAAASVKASPQAAVAAAPAAPASIYPLEPVTLTINSESSPYDKTNIEPEFQDIYWWDDYRERTGVTLEAVGGNSGAFDMSEQFLLLLASGDLPDLIRANWVTFPGGPNAAIDDGYIIALNDYEEYFPNLMQVYAENPDWYRMVKTDDGILYNFPYLRGDPDAHHENGLVIRQDWLDELDMPLPTTIDALTDTMIAMKDAYDLTSAFTFEMRWLWLEWAASSLSSAYSVTYPFYVVDKQVKFGPLEPGYREFMAQMASWYSQGLLDQDFPSINKATVQSKLASGDVGIAINPLNNTISCIEANLGTEYKLSGIPSIADPDTGEALFSQYYQTYDGSFGTAISTMCDKPEIACQFLDYLYSKEGQIFSTYGTEGLSFEMVDGVPKYNDFVMNNPDFVPGVVKSRTSNGANHPVIRLAFTEHMQDYAREVHKQWVNPLMADAIYPPTTFTSMESQIVSRYYNTINTYCQESMAQFITGQKNTDADFDAFVEQLKSFNIDTVLQMYQAAYDRYLAR